LIIIGLLLHVKDDDLFSHQEFDTPKVSKLPEHKFCCWVLLVPGDGKPLEQLARIIIALKI
jgi:hypothetical protein